MASVFDAIASATAPLNTGSNAATETWNHTCTGSNLILFVWITMNGNDVSGVTYNGVSMTLAGSGPSSIGRLYYLISPATGTNAVLVSFAGTGAVALGNSISYTGVNQTTGYRAFTSGASTTGSHPTVTVTTVSGDVVVDFVFSRANIISVHSGETTTQRSLLSSGSAGQSIGEATASGTSTVMGWDVTASADANYDCAVALIPAASATLEQEGFRWYEDNGSESGSSAAAAQDTNITAAAGATKRLRMLVNATGDPATKAYKLQYRIAAGSWADVL